MESKRQSIHGEWRGSWSFILAATAAAVGLGNIWKFPYVAGQHGGSAFVLIYLAAIIIIGVPLMMAEIGLGRNGRQNPFHTLKTLAQEGGRSTNWKWLGGLCIISGAIILSYYSVIAGWSLAYVFKTVSGQFIQSTPNSVNNIFQQLIASPLHLLFWHSLVMLATVLTVGMGVQRGIENAIRYIFPIMVVLLLILIGYAMSTGFFEKTILYLFRPDFHQLTPHIILTALGQAFFSLSLASGSIMMYGAYLPSRASVASSALAITFADTLIALLAGIATFPIVFAYQLAPSSGPGLIFQTLPIAFGKMPYGTLFGTIFFIMLVFAAFTSTISLLEPPTAWFVESFRKSRWTAATVMGSCIWILGIGTILSFNYWEDVKLLGFNIFSGLDYLASNLLLPLSGLLIAIFSVWLLNKDMMRDELQIKHKIIFKLWRFSLRYITPICIVLVFIHLLRTF